MEYVPELTRSGVGPDALGRGKRGHAPAHPGMSSDDDAESQMERAARADERSSQLEIGA